MSAKTTFFCQNCGTQYTKWQGQCHACKEWNTIVEEVVEKKEEKKWDIPARSKEQKNIPLQLKDIDIQLESRIITNDPELNRVLGGGIVSGSMILLGGEPGIGKSTLLLQLALQLKNKVLYVSGEESQKQIKLRAERITEANDNCFIISETNLQRIFKHLSKVNPDVLIVDSIQTLYTQEIESGAGSVSQIRGCVTELIKLAKETNIPIFIVGHITKEGQIAGPKIVEHMVDVVLQFEGDSNHLYRILRAQKNRFGSTSELGIYEMNNRGLRYIENPSELLISEKNSELSGQAIAATIEGIRVLMVEIQALVSSAVYGTPQRASTGFNVKRLNMLLAVLEKRAKFKLATKDVFLNITGGMNLEDPAIDLAVVMAILSSNYDIPLKKGVCFAAEIGLSGELRPISKIDQRIQEAHKIGFKKIIVSKFSKISNLKLDIEIILCEKIEEVAANLFS